MQYFGHATKLAAFLLVGCLNSTFCLALDSDNDGFADSVDSHPTDSNLPAQAFGGTGKLSGLSGIKNVGDVNNDGINDLIGKRHYVWVDGLAASLSLDVISGKNFKTLYKLPYVHDAYSGAGDVNNDGYDDIFLVTSIDRTYIPENRLVTLYSGKTGDILSKFLSNTNDTSFGYALSTAGDVNNDGFDEYIIGSPHHSNSMEEVGQITIYSGDNNNELFSIAGIEEYEGIARNSENLAAMGDLNGDGYDDIALGSPFYNHKGRVTVYSGLDQSPLYNFTGANNGDDFGSSVANIGDINNDNVNDIAIGASGVDNLGIDEYGKVFVYSGADGGMLLEVSPLSGHNRFGQNRIIGQFDINGDNISDFATACHSCSPSDLGAIEVFSSADGSLLYRFSKSDEGIYLPVSLGDVDGNGKDEIAGSTTDAAYILPWHIDQDADGLSDHWETVFGLNTQTDDSQSNLDGDLLNNLEEFTLSTNPLNPDTDGDTVNDDADAFPLDPNEASDLDNDGFGNNADNDSDNDLYPDHLDPAPMNDQLGPLLFSGGEAVLESNILIMGDLNQDGYQEYSKNSQIFSGKSHKELFKITPQPDLTLYIGGSNGEFDINNDGTIDFMVAGISDDLAPYDNPRFIYSGATGELITQLKKDSQGYPNNHRIIWEFLPDINNDGYDDYASHSIINYSYDDSDFSGLGHTDIISGKDHQTIYRFSANANDFTTSAFTRDMGDLNNDQYPDFYLYRWSLYKYGEDFHNISRKEIYSGKTGELLYDVNQMTDSFSAPHPIPLGDYNQDGFDDFLFAIDNDPYCPFGGMAILSGTDLSRLQYLCGDMNSLQFYGNSQPGGDFDGDDLEDFIVYYTSSTGKRHDRVYSSATGEILFAFSYPDEIRPHGLLENIGDFNADGKNDLLLSASVGCCEVKSFILTLLIDDDLDGLSSSYEIRYGLDPLVDEGLSGANLDSDPLTVLQEYELNTDPFKGDTDGDGVDDYRESVIGTDPLSEELLLDSLYKGLRLRNN